MNVPVIKLEFQSMKQSLLVALSEHTAKLDESFKAAVEKFCTPENIERILDESVRTTLDAAVREEVRTFFSYSNTGRLAVREAVTHHLNEMYSVDKEST